jgi:hypothetical protein
MYLINVLLKKKSLLGLYLFRIFDNSYYEVEQSQYSIKLLMLMELMYFIGRLEIEKTQLFYYFTVFRLHLTCTEI